MRVKHKLPGRLAAAAPTGTRRVRCLAAAVRATARWAYRTAAALPPPNRRYSRAPATT